MERGYFMEGYQVYKDISERTKGEIYLGVVGPVRTGKSTFIKRFITQMMLPFMEDEYARERTNDEMPQSAAGKTIMTTEPKFIPKEAVEVKLGEDTSVKLRLIDCVGFMVDGAVGHMENEKERFVKTPWNEQEIPFSKAAEIGTNKVIRDHSNIGLVITSDGSFGELSRDQYIPAEEKTVGELKRIGKPFLILLNSSKPLSSETNLLAKTLEEKYQSTVVPINCDQLKKEDIQKILELALYEFPITSLNFYLPKWVEMLDSTHPLKTDIITTLGKLLDKVRYMKDFTEEILEDTGTYISKIACEKKDLSNGNIQLKVLVNEEHYYNILSELTGIEIRSEYQMIQTIRNLAAKQEEFSKVSDAIGQVTRKGYGVVLPMKEDITLEEPQVIHTGNKYGVKIKAKAPSVHMIQADIMVEIAPIVGSQQQAEDLIAFIQENGENNENGIWDTNIFGKSIEQIVEDGIRNKLDKLSDETQSKMQETIQKITNDSNRGVICIII